MPCSERFNGCMTCGAEGDYCRRCKDNYLSDNNGSDMECYHCNTVLDHCAQCMTAITCDVCEEGYWFGLFGSTCGTSYLF